MADSNKIAEQMLIEAETDIADVEFTLVKVLDSLDELRRGSKRPTIRQVTYSGPVTVVVWSDGDITRTRCQDGDEYDRQTGLLFCIVKKAFPDWHELMTEHCWSE